MTCAAAEGLLLYFEEVDLLRQGVARDDGRLITVSGTMVLAKAFAYVLCFPSNATAARARHARDSGGPGPLRSARWPRGYPWLNGPPLRRVQADNAQVDWFVQRATENADLRWMLVLP
jgi:hypothetical protein